MPSLNKSAMQEPAQSSRDQAHPLAQAAVDFQAEGNDEQAPWNDTSHNHLDAAAAETVEQSDNIFGPAHEFD